MRDTRDKTLFVRAQNVVQTAYAYALCYPNVLHDNAKSRGTCQRAIRSEQGCIVDTGGSYVKGIVGTDVMAVLPGFLEQRCVCNTVDRPGEEVFNSQPRALLCKLLVEYRASQDRQHLYVQQGRGKDEGSRNEVSQLEAQRRAQKIFRSGGGIDHIADHVRSCSRCCRSCASS